MLSAVFWFCFSYEWCLFCVQIGDENGLRQLAEVLTVNGIDHKLWIEQPENIATCLATKPYQKQEVQQHFAALKLFK